MADEKWECGPHANAWGGHDARCRRVPDEAERHRVIDDAFDDIAGSETLSQEEARERFGTDVLDAINAVVEAYDSPPPPSPPTLCTGCGRALTHPGEWCCGRSVMSVSEFDDALRASRAPSPRPGSDALPWSKPFRRRCPATLARENGTGYWGRCDLAPHLPQYEHALERGMEVVRWSASARIEVAW